MLKFYSHITKKANLKGASLNSLAGLSIENTSEENKNLIEKVFDTLEGSEYSLFKPEAFFHPRDLHLVIFRLAYLESKGININIEYYDDRVLNDIGDMIDKGNYSPSKVEVHLEDYRSRRMCKCKFDSGGYLTGNYMVGYFS